MDILESVISEAKDCGGDIFAIGESVCGNPVICIHKGSYVGRRIIVTAAIHARECYTAFVVLRQAHDFDSDTCGVYFVPLVNPDGALFFENGCTFGKPLLECNALRRREWKANADGVDLNTHFDALWGRGECNKRVPGPSDYIGDSPHLAPETRALAELTKSVVPDATVSYHCMGGELYWEFFQDGRRRARDEMFAAAIARRIGVKKVDGHLNSAGGYKDYCVDAFGIPAVTVELIKSGTHPFARADFEEEITANADLPTFAFGILEKLSESL